MVLIPILTECLGAKTLPWTWLGVSRVTWMAGPWAMGRPPLTCLDKQAAVGLQSGRHAASLLGGDQRFFSSPSHSP